TVKAMKSLVAGFRFLLALVGLAFASVLCLVALKGHVVRASLIAHDLTLATSTADMSSAGLTTKDLSYTKSVTGDVYIKMYIGSNGGNSCLGLIKLSNSSALFPTSVSVSGHTSPDYT